MDEKQKAYFRDYYKKNPKRYRDSAMRWRLKNTEKFKSYMKAYHLRRKEEKKQMKEAEAMKKSYKEIFNKEHE